MARVKSNPRPLDPKQEGEIDWQVILKAVAISGNLLGVVLAGLTIYLPRLWEHQTTLSRGLQVGLTLLFFWLIVTSTMRGVQYLRKNVPAWKLLVCGLLVTFWGTLLFKLIRMAFAPMKKSGWEEVVFFGTLGLLASLISLIHLRIKSRYWGNILEIILIGAVIFLFFYLMK